jgi:hypothetical protein
LVGGECVDLYHKLNMDLELDIIHNVCAVNNQ